MRKSYRFRYWVYELIMDVATNFKGPVWLWALRRQENLQKKECMSGRPWRMN